MRKYRFFGKTSPAASTALTITTLCNTILAATGIAWFIQRLRASKNPQAAIQRHLSAARSKVELLKRDSRSIDQSTLGSLYQDIDSASRAVDSLFTTDSMDHRIPSNDRTRTSSVQS